MTFSLFIQIAILLAIVSLHFGPITEWRFPGHRKTQAGKVEWVGTNPAKTTPARPRPRKTAKRAKGRK